MWITPVLRIITSCQRVKMRPVFSKNISLEIILHQKPSTDIIAILANLSERKKKYKVYYFSYSKKNSYLRAKIKIEK